MKVIRNGLLILCAIILGTTCTERFDVDLGSTYTRLVVEGSISTDTMAHEVKLSRSADYFYNKSLEPVSGASVSITDGTNVFPLTEDPQDSGTYRTAPNVYGVPGRTYILTISNVDINNDGKYEDYSASGRINALVQPDSIQVVKNTIFYTTVWEIRLYANDPAATRDYYMFRTWKNGRLLTDTINEISLLDDEYFNGVNSNGMPIQYLSAGKEDEITRLGDKIMLETMNITKEYYDFVTELISESQGSDPFGGQPANVSTNLSNGAIGFFATYSVTRIFAVYKGD